MRTNTISQLCNKNIISSFLLMVMLFVMQTALVAQPLPPDDDIGIPPMHGNGEGRRQGKMRKEIEKNFSWEKAEKNILPLIKKENPQLYLFILKNRDKNSPLSKRLTRGLAIMSMGQEDHPEDFNKMFLMGVEDLDIERLADLYNQESSEAQKIEIKNQIRTKLINSFDKKEKMRAEIISRLEEHLKKQKSEHQKRQDNKSKIVEKRLKKLLEYSDDLDW